jgi:hypothetical protein
MAPLSLGSRGRGPVPPLQGKADTKYSLQGENISALHLRILSRLKEMPYQPQSHFSPHSTQHQLQIPALISASGPHLCPIPNPSFLGQAKPPTQSFQAVLFASLLRLIPILSPTGSHGTLRTISGGKGSKQGTEGKEVGWSRNTPQANHLKLLI